MDSPETSYGGRHAALYDIFYADKPYAEEAEFVHQCIQRYKPGSQDLLELACGTGTHSLQLEKHGYRITAIDYSGDMLARAREKAAASGSEVRFIQQDMRTLNVQERPFDAVICLFDSIGYVVTNSNITQVFARVHDHLKPGGLFIFEFWHAAAMLRGYDPLRLRRWQVAGGELLRISETTIDYERQLCSVSYTIYEPDDNGGYSRLQETQINRFFLVQEMEALLQNSGLVPEKWFPSFREDDVIDDQCWHIVGVARRIGVS